MMVLRDERLGGRAVDRGLVAADTVQEKAQMGGNGREWNRFG